MSARGAALVQVLVAVALLALGLLVAVPHLGRIGVSAHAAAGARLLASRFQALRFESIARNRHVGLWFRRSGDRWEWLVVRDGNGNGLRMAEVGGGVDPAVGPADRFGAVAEHARLGFPPGGPFRGAPPGRGTIASGADPVRFGAADLVRFAPLGTSSSGTVYVTDGRHALFAVVLYGRSAKVTVWRYDTRTGRWKR